VRVLLLNHASQTWLLRGILGTRRVF